MDKIAVLIPCYNEASTIGKVVRDFREVLPEAVIYVYDNNSTDQTAVLAREAGAVVRQEHRQGKGNVIRTMFRDVDAQCYLMVDGDDTYPAEYARQMADAVLLEGADMVQVAVTRTRPAGRYHLMDAQNPVWIFSGEGRA